MRWRAAAAPAAGFWVVHASCGAGGAGLVTYRLQHAAAPARAPALWRARRPGAPAAAGRAPAAATAGRRAAPVGALGQRGCRGWPLLTLTSFLARPQARLLYHEAAGVAGASDADGAASQRRSALLAEAYAAAAAATALAPASYSCAALRATLAINLLLEESALLPLGARLVAAGKKGSKAAAAVERKCGELRERLVGAMDACKTALAHPAPLREEPVIAIDSGSHATSDPCSMVRRGESAPVAAGRRRGAPARHCRSRNRRQRGACAFAVCRRPRRAGRRAGGGAASGVISACSRAVPRLASMYQRLGGGLSMQLSMQLLLCNGSWRDLALTHCL